jgi:type VI secretion system secreted protein Hcp
MASDYLLEIDGIKGESHDSKHKDTIEIESFSWGASHPGSFSSGGGGGTGKVSFQDLHFVTPVNKASPLVAKACATGQHIKKAVLFVRKAGGKQEEFYKVTIEDILVSSYQSGGHGGSGQVPTDQFSLNFAKIEFEYSPQDEKGGLSGKVAFKYDVKQNVAG